MASVEDAASVLEQFVQDVANLPAEMAHLLEEIQAKDRNLQACRDVINDRDSRIQKFAKMNGMASINPKERPHSEAILANFDNARNIQEEKLVLASKAATLLDRQIRRLDIKMRDLQNEGSIPVDPTLPSLLHPTVGNRAPPISNLNTASSTPLNPLSGNAGPSTTIANSSFNRLTQAVSQSSSQSSLNINTSLPHNTHNTGGSPASTVQLQQRVRESSANASDTKRRRLNIPSNISALRQTSLGPGTPKAGTPISVRGGSAGPRIAGPKKPGKRVAPHQRVNHLNPIAANKKSRRRPGKKLGTKGTPSETGDEESVLSDVENSESENPSQVDGSADVEMDIGIGEGVEEDDGGDDRTYCTCQSKSSGNMVACDNPECPYEWFHWSCVGMTKEPVGAWFCDECRPKIR